MFLKVFQGSYWKHTEAEGLSGLTFRKKDLSLCLSRHSSSWLKLLKGTMPVAANATWSRVDLHLQPVLTKGHTEARALANDLRWNTLLNGSCFLHLDFAGMSKGIPFSFNGKREVSCFSFCDWLKSILGNSFNQHICGISWISRWSTSKCWHILSSVFILFHSLPFWIVIRSLSEILFDKNEWRCRPITKNNKIDCLSKHSKVNHVSFSHWKKLGHILHGQRLLQWFSTLY